MALCLGLTMWAGTRKVNQSRFYWNCCSGSSRWWTWLPGSCFLHPDTIKSHRSSVSCTSWWHRSKLTTSLLFLYTNAYMEQHHRMLTNSACRLRSALSPSLVVRRMSTIGDRAFPVSTAHAWNGPPHHVTSTPSLSSFSSRLKTPLSALLSLTAFLSCLSCDCHFATSYSFIIIIKNAPRFRQMIAPTPLHSVFCRPDTLPATEPTNSVKTLKEA